MELNKNIYSGYNFVLPINWNSCTKIGHSNIRGAYQINPAAFPVALEGKHLYIYNACETDRTIMSQLVSSVNSGEFSWATPFIYCQKFVSSSGTSNAIQQRINASYGSTLLRTYFGCFYITETGAAAYDPNDNYIVD